VQDYGFIDTLREVGGLWNFDSKKLDSVSNQYAAMPSLHIGWSTWCMLVLLRFGKRRSTKILGVLYPLFTLLVIVATANHYILDAAGGLVIIGAGYSIARGVEALRARQQEPVADVASEDVLVPS
ncbi:MAG TPA: phosphatase PAP2 family protein, partial [Ilumatobacteraceae bacterium]